MVIGAIQLMWGRRFRPPILAPLFAVLLAQDHAAEGPPITVRAQVAGSPVELAGRHYLPLAESSAPGLALHGDPDRFRDAQSGDWIEIHGRLESGSIAAESIRKMTHDVIAAPRDIPLSAILRRHVGLWLRAPGTVPGDEQAGRSAPSARFSVATWDCGCARTAP